MLTFFLDLQTTDDDVLEQNIRHAVSQGYTFTTLQALGDSIEQVYWLHQECRKRQPPIETRQQPQDSTLWRDTFGSSRGNPELYHILVRETEYVGVSCLVKTEQIRVFNCGFTGILPLHAKQGLALALKSHMLLAAKRTGIKHVRTSVRADNTAMLSLNSVLGFIQSDATTLLL